MGYLNFNIYIYLYRERGWEKASKPGFSAWHSSLTYGFSFFFLISPFLSTDQNFSTHTAQHSGFPKSWSQLPTFNPNLAVPILVPSGQQRLCFFSRQVSGI